MKHFLILLATFFLINCSNAQTVVNEITNGDFSNLTNNWTISSQYWWISNAFSCYNSATAYAYVGNANGTGANSTSGSMYQTFTIPANATSAVLLFSLSINTDETTTTNVYDVIYVQLRDQNMNLLYTFATYSNLNGVYPSGGCQSYQAQAFTVPANYFGQSLRLNFQTANDANLPTKFRIDDVSLSATLPCSYTLSPSSYTCPNTNAATYSNISNVTAAAGCNWTANVTAGGTWLSTTSSGNGNGTVTITVSQNTSLNSRTGTINVGGQTLTVTQPGTTCNYSLSPGSYSCPNSNANTYNSVSNVTAPAGCSWTANVTSGGTWLSTTSSGNGNGSVSITVIQNTSLNSRTGTIDVGGQTLTINQPGTACNYSLSASSYSCPNSNTNTYNGVSNVTAPAGCSWTANVTSGGTWLSTTSSGNGNGSVSITVTQNTNLNSRTGTIDVGGQTLTITQPGAACNYSLSASSYSCANSNTNTYNSVSSVTAPATCSWTANVISGGIWLSTTSSGNGNGSVSITVTQNTNLNSRTGTIDVGGQTLTITQPGSSPNPIVTVTSPNGYELWTAGSTHNITGTLSPGASAYEFQYSINNGYSWTPITYSTNVAASVSYPWQVPNSTSNNCLIKLMGYYNNNIIYDYSDAQFTISAQCIPVTNDYPFPNSNCNGVDPWNFYKGNCTSYVAWEVNNSLGFSDYTLPSPQSYPFNNQMAQPHYNALGNAKYWSVRLASIGIQSNQTPTVGAIAHWNENENNFATSDGHVAYVNCVNGSIVTLTAYNEVSCSYNTRNIDISLPDGITLPNGLVNHLPGRYIHIEAGLGSTTSLNNATTISDFEVFPNPSHGPIDISINTNKDISGDLIFYNAVGQIILSKHIIGADKHSFDLSSLPLGLYLVQLKTNQECITRKFEIY